jgi:RHS repeat-associated protein
VEFNPVSASRVRVLMALGAFITPRLMRGNEIQAFRPSMPPPPQPDTDYVASYTYDCNGNQLTRGVVPVGAPPSSETFSYDYANRLASYVKAGPVSASFTYLYAPSGERLNKLDVSAAEAEWYMLDGEDVVTDYSQVGAGSLAHEVSYVQPVAIDSKVARVVASGGAEHFYVPDALGSVTHLLDASQVIVNSEATDAWGNVVASGAAVQDRYGFTQREKDTESGLMHFRARGYDPRLGRFCQVDPYRPTRERSHYIYAANRPVLLDDVSGRQEGTPEQRTTWYGRDYEAIRGQEIAAGNFTARETTMLQEALSVLSGDAPNRIVIGNLRITLSLEYGSLDEQHRSAAWAETKADLTHLTLYAPFFGYPSTWTGPQGAWGWVKAIGKGIGYSSAGTFGGSVLGGPAGGVAGGLAGLYLAYDEESQTAKATPLRDKWERAAALLHEFAHLSGHLDEEYPYVITNVFLKEKRNRVGWLGLESAKPEGWDDDWKAASKRWFEEYSKKNAGTSVIAGRNKGGKYKDISDWQNWKQLHVDWIMGK